MRTAGRAAADLRLLRAAVFAAVCVALSAAGHALAGGGVPGVGVLVVGGVAVLACAAPMAGRERAVPGIPVVLMAGQLALHVLFCLAAVRPAGADGRLGVVALAERLRCGTGGPVPSPADAVGLLRDAGLSDADVIRMLGAARPSAHAMPGMPGAHTMAGMSMGVPVSPGALALHILPSPWMLVAHAVAAALMGLLLWRGEVALWILTARPVTVVVPRSLTALRAVLRVLAAVGGAADNARLRVAASAVRDVTGSRWASPDLRQPVVRRGPPFAVTAV
ncbi:hypothetical protein ABZ901_02930 [Actinacidiphila alni]|uniref:hypothetical protein n=1 Tax=Actinacidiphila alni TaxID=380248 RepID=UPI0033EAB538